jgi:hypothetical protein
MQRVPGEASKREEEKVEERRWRTKRTIDTILDGAGCEFS